MGIEAGRGDRQRVGEGAGDQDAVESPGSASAGCGAAVGPARAADADREVRRAERLDEVLLAHHRRLAGQHGVAVLRGVLQRVAVERIAFAEAFHAVEAGVHRRPRGPRCRRGPCDVPAARAAGALDGDQPPVPAPGRRAPGRRASARRVEQHGALVDAAVDRRGLDPHDEGHGQAGRGGGRGDVGRRLAGARQRYEHSCAARQVEIGDLGLRPAVRSREGPSVSSLATAWPPSAA